MSITGETPCSADSMVPIDEMQAELDNILNPKKREISPEMIEKLRLRRRREFDSYKTAPKVVPGGAVVYVGRLPPGFEENQVREYFSQFGQIGRLRIRRNPRTGSSRHACFVEFRLAEVAAIVVETMHNYLIKGRLMQCSLVSEEKIHSDMWKGANRKIIKSNSMTKPRKVRPSAKVSGLEKVLKSKPVEERILAANQKISNSGIKYDFEMTGTLADLL